MTTTRSTLLARLKNRSDAEAWSQFQKLYAPLLYRYARGRGLSREDAEDIRDQCLEAVARKIGTFEYDKEKGGFKNWLYQIAHRKTIDLLRKRHERIADSRELGALPDPGPTPDEIWERHWEQEHLRYCFEQIRGSVSEMNYRAFHMLLFEECSVDEVCGRLGLNANQVYKAKSRVLRRVRQHMARFDSDIPV